MKFPSKIEISIDCDKQGGTCGDCKYLSKFPFLKPYCYIFDKELGNRWDKPGRCNECIWHDEKVNQFTDYYKYYFSEAFKVLQDIKDGKCGSDPRFCPICDSELKYYAHTKNCIIGKFFEELKEWEDCPLTKKKE